MHGTSLRTPGHPRNALACGTLANKKSSWILFYWMLDQIYTFEFLKLFGWRMIVNDLGFDCFIFWGGDNTLHGTSLRTLGQPRYALACGTLANKSSSWILFRLMIEQIHSNGKPYWCTE